jgi:hypothetical protein
MLQICRFGLIVLLGVLVGCATGGPGRAPVSSPPPGVPAPPAQTSPPPDIRPTPSPPEASLGNPLSLRAGEAVSVGVVRLALVAIENDSRCPTQVSCVWEGAVTAVVDVTIAGQPGKTVTLTIAGQDRETDESRAQVGGYTIRLTALTPYPAEPQPIDQGDYVATVVVDKAGSAYARVRSGSVEGVIVPEQDASALDPQAQSYWTPAEADVQALEAGLVTFLQSSPPQASPMLWEKQSTYRRQYAGLVRNGQRLVYASFFCDTLGEDWQREVVFVLDGGDCFFQLTYDVERGTYDNLMVNGES